MAMASTYVFCISDMSEKLIRRRLEWPLFELHSTLQCRDICRSKQHECSLGVCLLEYIPALTWPQLSLHWNRLQSSNWHHSTPFEVGFLAESVLNGFKLGGNLLKMPRLSIDHSPHTSGPTRIACSIWLLQAICAGEVRRLGTRLEKDTEHMKQLAWLKMRLMIMLGEQQSRGSRTAIILGHCVFW